MPSLLKALGVKKVLEINCNPDGDFAHNPEPVKENLIKTSEIIRESNVDVGFVVDPDVDRLVLSMKMVPCLTRNTLWWQWLIMYWE